MNIETIPKHVKCDCGHTAKDHFNGEGFCHHSGHPKAGECGCTFYYPNVKWINKQKSKKNEHHLRR